MTALRARSRWWWGMAVLVIALSTTACPASTPVNPPVVAPAPNPVAPYVARLRAASIVYDTVLAAAGDALRGDLITREQYDTVEQAGVAVQTAGNIALGALLAYLSLPTDSSLTALSLEVTKAETELATMQAKFAEVRDGNN